MNHEAIIELLEKLCYTGFLVAMLAAAVTLILVFVIIVGTFVIEICRSLKKELSGNNDNADAKKVVMYK
jgi:hypothetical protein